MLPKGNAGFISSTGAYLRPTAATLQNAIIENGVCVKAAGFIRRSYGWEGSRVISTTMCASSMTPLHALLHLLTRNRWAVTCQSVATRQTHFSHKHSFPTCMQFFWHEFGHSELHVRTQEVKQAINGAYIYAHRPLQATTTLSRKIYNRSVFYPSSSITQITTMIACRAPMVAARPARCVAVRASGTDCALPNFFP